MKNFLKLGTIALLAGILPGILAGILAVAAGPGTAGAQTQQRVDAKQDWSIFQAGAEGQSVCWIVSRPTRSAAFRNGRSVEVQRGEIFLMVSIRPADSVENEVSFISGYPYKVDSKVTVKVGAKEFELYNTAADPDKSKREYAWAPSAEDDAALVDAFRRGAKAKIVGYSRRGTRTVDTFSLSGFTAALEVAINLCK